LTEFQEFNNVRIQITLSSKALQMRSINIAGIRFMDRERYDCRGNNEQLLIQLNSQKCFLEYDFVHEYNDRMLLESPTSSISLQQNILLANGLTQEQIIVLKKIIKLIEKDLEYNYYLIIIN
jgi:hypothetical protein